MSSRKSLLRPRPRVVLTAFLLTFLAAFVSLSPHLSEALHSVSRRVSTSQSASSQSTWSSPSCSPHAWGAGQWKFNPHKHPGGLDAPLNTAEDVLALYGFQGCGSKREYDLHLGLNRPEKFYRMRNLTSYEWIPGEECQEFMAFDPEALVRELVEEGGWLLVGDSVTEGHFFALSCMLYPHVRASYDEMLLWDRAWPQSLYLNPYSPLIPYLNFPPNFDIDTTPLVTTRRVDILFSREDLVEIYNEAYEPPPEFELINWGQLVYTVSPSYYLRVFTDPKNNYKTLVASTAGHWTTALFGGIANYSMPDQGNLAIVRFFEVAAAEWAHRVQNAITQSYKTTGKQRVALVRGYLPGHDDCHENRVEDGGPWAEYDEENGRREWNWFYIRDFNRAFRRALTGNSEGGNSMARKHKDVYWLGLEQPGLLRPDTHTSGDCLHIMAGPGVNEGWTHYISHFLLRELPHTPRV